MFSVQVNIIYTGILCNVCSSSGDTWLLQLLDLSHGSELAGDRLSFPLQQKVMTKMTTYLHMASMKSMYLNVS